MGLKPKLIVSFLGIRVLSWNINNFVLLKGKKTLISAGLKVSFKITSTR